LPGGVPDLELAEVAVDLQGFEAEVDADGCEVVVDEHVVAEAEEEAGFSCALVAGDYEFEQKVELFYHRIIN
jgi:hypothetical protein